VLDKIIKLYLESSPKLLETLHDTIAEDRQARKLDSAGGSQLKSCSANLRANRLAALCGEIEGIARQDWTTGAEKMLNEIERRRKTRPLSMASCSGPPPRPS
jgi:HPt (histidine-containing phosphotransfer) domain-containing protein